MPSRQSTIIGEDPLYQDHDPVAVIDLVRSGTQGFTKSPAKLVKSLTVMGDSLGGKYFRTFTWPFVWN